MSDSNIWRSLTRIITLAMILLAGLWAIDSIGHVFVPHSIAYWIGLCTFILVASAWHDLFPGGENTRVETRRTRFFRLFYQGVLLFVALVVVDRISDPILSPANSPIFWICLVLALVLLVGWHDLVMTRIGQKFLSSAFLERVTLVLGSLIMMLVVLELFVRTEFSRFHVFGIWPRDEVYTDPLIAFHNNAAGFRDSEEHSIEGKPGVTRVLILGDSFAAGQGVSQTDYFPARLREMAGSSFEFIAAVQPAAETIDELGFLRDYGCQFHPDVVLVGVFTNDAYLDTHPWPAYYSVFKKLESPYSFNPQLMDFFDGQINSALCSFGKYCYQDWLFDIYSPSRKSYLDEWRGIVRELAAASKECGATHLYAFTLPEATDYSDPEVLQEFERIHAILTDGFTEGGFDTTNLFHAYLEHFGGRPYRSVWSVPNDFHPNAEVHQWYAEQIWTKIGPELQNGR